MSLTIADLGEVIWIRDFLEYRRFFVIAELDIDVAAILGYSQTENYLVKVFWML